MSHSYPANRLADETSPYLRQHAHNPVDWYPWGPEALERARQLDRPIFLSIGYSACHWCHVMEHESFEDPEIAQILNENFVSIKVDREERPDLDQVYMTAVQAMTGQGGWPMSMFLTPELKPFYGGTYFPPDDRYGRPSFKRLLKALIDAWHTRRDELLRTSTQLTDDLSRAVEVKSSSGTLDHKLLQDASRLLQRAFDHTFGGFGSAPKFPHPMDIRLLLRIWKRFGDESALQMVRVTLDHMARGGIYDHLGGGFHRYSTDERWLVPHFEKMLYDNALLTVAYLEGFQATGDPGYREVVEETLAYVLREMTSPEGAFYSTQDADSEGEEGKFYVWTAAEIEQLLGKERADTLGYVYDVNPGGNWEGHTILHRSKSDEQDARLLGKSLDDLHRELRESEKILFEARSKRVWPGRDEKYLTSWNALMIGAFARAAGVLGNPAYLRAATGAATFVLQRMRQSDGRLFRTGGASAKPKLNAYLEDYAFLIDALLDLYEATMEPGWVEESLRLTDVMIREFWDEAEGGFFYTGRSHEQLITRSKDPHDSSIPSGNSMAATALLRLTKLTGRKDLAEYAEKTLQLFRELMVRSPTAAGQMLMALDFHLGPVQEFAVVSDGSEEELQRALRAIRVRFLPNKVLAAKSGQHRTDQIDKLIPLLADRTTKRGVTTYICKDFVCEQPIVGVEALDARLRNEQQQAAC